MRYSFYKGDPDAAGYSTFRLYVETADGPVLSYKFMSDIQEVSKEPGITRLFGKQVEDIAGEYFLYPVDYNNVEVGYFDVIEVSEKFIKLKFMEQEGNSLEGIWYLRLLSSGGMLFWKPFPVVSVMPTKNVEVKLEEGEEIIPIQQTFNVFSVAEEIDGSFSGIAAAEGVWTGGDLHTTLFTGGIIEKIAEQMGDKMKDQVVDYNHDFVNSGRINTVELREERGIKHIFVSGKGFKPIPHGSGLSITLKSTIKWNNNLNVFVLIKAEPLGVSIITASTPACTICKIR